jgi:hypothetical protein
MGNVNSAVIENVADIAIRSNGSQVLAKTSGAVALLQKFQNSEEMMTPVYLTFLGELSSHIKNQRRNITLEEPNSIYVKYSFSLNHEMDNFNLSNYQYPTNTIHGTGTITFRSTQNGTVSSIPLCLDSLTIDGDNSNLARATYKGYISKGISLSDTYDMDSCVTCMIKLTALPI